jgi:hypothetical protein
MAQAVLKPIGIKPYTKSTMTDMVGFARPPNPPALASHAASASCRPSPGPGSVRMTTAPRNQGGAHAWSLRGRAALPR